MQNVTHLVKNLWNMQNSFISLIHYCSSSIKDTDSCNTQYIFFYVYIRKWNHLQYIRHTGKNKNYATQ